MTIDTEITSIRYDLRDTDSTQFTDAELLDFYNRCVRALASALASVKSDWVLSDDTLTIVAGDNYVALPSDFSTPIHAEIDEEPLTKKEPRVIKKWQQQTSSGTPEYYGIHQSNLIFERAAGSNTDVYFQYNTKATALVTGAPMPYSDEFNDPLKSAVIMLAKNRNERDITGDYALQSFFLDNALAKSVRRSFSSHKNLGF